MRPCATASRQPTSIPHVPSVPSTPADPSICFHCDPRVPSVPSPFSQGVPVCLYIRPAVCIVTVHIIITPFDCKQRTGTPNLHSSP